MQANEHLEVVKAIYQALAVGIPIAAAIVTVGVKWVTASGKTINRAKFDELLKLAQDNHERIQKIENRNEEIGRLIQQKDEKMIEILQEMLIKKS